jgi:hypothetical protein
MIRYVKVFIKYLTHLKTSKVLLSFMNQGYLIETGWLNTIRQGKKIDANNSPVPWCTYSYNQFIENQLTKKMSLFEYGSGYSTLFYSKRVNKVIALEHNMSWVEQLRPQIDDNTELVYKTLSDNYSTYILSRPEFFDVIVIDGRQRVKCIESAIQKVSAKGIVVLDDSERDYYKDGISLLTHMGFLRIDFWGISPGYFHNKCTSIFCRDFNSFLS